MVLQRSQGLFLPAVQIEARGKMCGKWRLRAIFLARNIRAYAQRRSAHNAPQYAKVSNPVKNGKVFGQAFFKRLAWVVAFASERRQSPTNTACAPKKVNCEIVRWTISQ